MLCLLIYHYTLIIAVEVVLGQIYELDGHLLDVKKAIPKGSSYSHKEASENKLFVGGLSADATTEDLKVYFESHFGDVVNAIVMMDRDTGRSRGFGFVTFKNASYCHDVLGQSTHFICGKSVEVKRAEPATSKPSQVENRGAMMCGRISNYIGAGAYPMSYGHGMYPAQIKYMQMRYAAMIAFQNALARNSTAYPVTGTTNYYSYKSPGSYDRGEYHEREEEEESDDDVSCKKRRF